MIKYNKIVFMNFIKVLSSISFLTANLVVFWILMKFSNLKNQGVVYKTLFATMGVILAILFIRPNWFLSLSNHSNSCKSHSHKIIDSLFSLKWNGPKIAMILLISRTWFFSTLNYMFLVLITWIGYFWIATLIGIAHWDSTSINMLFGVLSTIGILSGLFQFYFRYYREEVLEKFSDAFGEYFKQFIEEMSPKSFLEFLKKEKPQLYSILKQKTSIEVFRNLPQWLRIQRGPGKTITNIIIPYLPDEHIIIWGIENELINLGEKEKAELKAVYKEFFTEKTDQIKKRIRNINIDDIREVFILNPFLVDDIWMMITNIKYELPPTKENPVTFKDYMLNAIEEILLYFTKRVTGEVE